ncbi:MAG TPA: MBL fold metallo-hydrolase [Chthoniobacteraceae bacterium]|jgi:ribonuclease BN (tRNA processing enzyme)/CheY-like chemotaxis protein
MSSAPPVARRILIGEDVHALAFRMAQALENLGYETEVAHDGLECLHKSREDETALLILDAQMSSLQVADFIRALRADFRTETLPVLLCLPEAQEAEFAVNARSLGIGFLRKPFDADELIRKVQRLLSHEGQGENLPPPQPANCSAFNPSLNRARGCFTLWGTRGSTPVPGARFLRHGGNTSCMSVTYGDARFIFDAGSGIRDLGQEVMAGTHRKLHLFVTHTHWDHIQGFPFFTPAYVPGFEITIHGAEGFGKDLRSVFRSQLDRDFFPVQMEDMNSNLQFRHLHENPMVFGDVKVHWEYSQHPGATVGYKIDVAGYKIAWVPDNEFLRGYTGAPDALDPTDAMFEPYRKMIAFLSDVDLLIHEAQYTNEEYPKKVRWGHSSVSNVCLLTKLAGVKRWIVTHHDPMHDDEFLETKLNMTRQMLAAINHPIQVSHGYDGLTEYL